MTTELQFENQVVLDMVQAFIGSISSRMKAISVSTRLEQSTVDLHVAFSEIDALDRSLIDETLFDFDALTNGAILVHIHLWAGENWTKGWPGRDFRKLYAAADENLLEVGAQGVDR